jgi:hypothetical protein
MTLFSAPDGTPGATAPGTVMLAGLLMAPLGTFVPPGLFGCLVAALAVSVTEMLAVQAPDNRASGTSAVAFCHVVSLFWDIVVNSPESLILSPNIQY